MSSNLALLAPLLFAVLFPTISAPIVLVDVIRAALAASLTGAFAALLVVGYQIAKPRPKLS